MSAPVRLHPSDQTLLDYARGTLDEARADSISAHLEDCEDCRHRASETSAAGDSFVGRLRDARPRAEATRSVVSPDMAPPVADGIPPELAGHPQYEIRKELGRGGMGVVYLAYNREMDRLEVLKILNQDLLARRGTLLDRFLREIRTAGKLHHANIVTAYTTFQVGPLRVLAMEYVEGENLADLVKKRGALPVNLSCHFIAQAAQGLQHAHEAGMVHRDIKPGNLMVCRQGQKAVVKVLDFGLAKAIHDTPVEGSRTQEGQALGTPDYNAPEQILNARNADIRADIYSLGCTLYYLLTGKPPFQGASLYDVYQAHISREADPPNLVRPEVPVELAAVVAKMMAKEPDRRYQTPAEVAEALRPFWKPGAMPAPVPKPAPRHSPAVNPASPPPSLAPSSAVRPAPATARVPAEPAPEARWKSLIEFPASERSNDPAPAVRNKTPRGPWKRWPWLVAASGFGAVLLLGLVIHIVINRDSVQVEVKRTPEESTGRINHDKIPVEANRTPGEATGRSTPDPGSGKEVPAVDQREPVETRVDDAPDPGSGKEVPAVPTKSASPWVSLFNGRDLTGWKTHPSQPGQWRVENGVLIGSGAETSHLYTERGDYQDFHLRVEARINDGGNSGVYVRSSFGPTLPINQPKWPGGYEAQINDTARNGPPTGSLYAHSVVVATNTESAVRPFEWFTMEVIAGGKHITVMVNGMVTAYYLDEMRLVSGGHIALQQLDDATKVEFRKIEIRELGPNSSAGNAPVSPALPRTMANSINMKLVLIPAGEFLMGSPNSDEDALGDEKPQHKVRITRPFYLGETEVTQAQYLAVTGKNPSNFRDSLENPVEIVSWFDAVRFCNALSTRDGLAPFYRIEGNDAKVPDWNGPGYRLPTEAEWEYACRAGSTTRFGFGDDESDLSKYAWFTGNSGDKTHPVGQKRPTAFGLYDMQGNVSEWCGDKYKADYYKDAPTDDPQGPSEASVRVYPPTAARSRLRRPPQGSSEAPDRVFRGGGWRNLPWGCRPAYRLGLTPDSRISYLGFRVAASPVRPVSQE